MTPYSNALPPVMIAIVSSSLRQIVHEALAPLEITLHIFTDTDSALSALPANQPFCLILGQQIGTAEFIQQAHERIQYRNIRIMMIVPHDPASIDDALSRGATDCLLLPLHPELLRRQVEQMLHPEKDLHQLAEAFYDTSAALNRSLDVGEVARRILTQVKRLMPDATANVLLVDEQVGRIIDSVGEGASHETGSEWPVLSLPTYQAMIATRSPIIITDVRSSPLWTQHDETDWVRSYLGTPIILDEQVIGFINLNGSRPGQFVIQDMVPLTAFANQAAVAIQNARLFERVKHDAEELERRVSQRTAELTSVVAKLQEEIAERQRVEKALERDRNLLRILIDNLSDHIYIKDRQSRFVVVNRSLAHFLKRNGYTDYVGRSDFDIYPEDEARRYYEAEQHLMATGESLVDVQMEVQIGDAEPLSLLVSKYPLYDADGQVIGLVCINHDMTRLLAAQQQLVTERRLLQHIIDTIPDAIYTRNRQGQYSLVNRALLNFMGHNSAEQIIGKQHMGWWDPEVADQNLAEDQQVMETEKAILNEERFYNPAEGGEQLCWLVTKLPLLGSRGTVYGMLCIFRDITDRYRNQQALQQAKDELENRVERRTRDLARLNAELLEENTERRRAEGLALEQRHLADSLRVASSVLNRNLELDAVLDAILDVVDQVSPAYDLARIVLAPPDSDQVHVVSDDGSSRTRRTLIRTDALLHEMPGLAAMLEHQQPVVIDNTHLEPDWQCDADRSWVVSHISVPIIIADQIAGMLSLDSRTEAQFNAEHADHLQAFANQAAIAIQNARLLERLSQHATELEQRVSERTAELDMERAQLRAILDSMYDGVVLLSPDFQVDPASMYFNQALLKLTGFSAQEWLSGRPIAAMRQMIGQQQYDALVQSIHQVLVRDGFWQDEIRLPHKDGSVYDALVTLVTVPGTDGAKGGYLTIIHDISQAKELEEQKRRFITSASHELRTPITNIKARLYLMRRQPEKLEEHISVTTQVVNLMQRLVEDMFDLSRFERGVFALDLEQLNLQDLVGDVLSFHQPQAERQNIRLESELPAEPIVIRADPYRLMQVITNLLVNAMNYSPEGERVQVLVYQDRAMLGDIEKPVAVIEVRDQGAGIAPEHLPHVFRPFYRVSADNRGSGLGLSISQEIVKLHGGAISVQSQPGEGCSFIVSLPLGTATPPDEKK